MPTVPMKKGTKRMWRIAPKDGTDAIAIAEPKHRSGAIGLSSGVSLRKVPKSTVQKVREICTHYVEKCSGKYDQNKVAARYVYQMADEVINQLSGVAAQIRSLNVNQPENLQELLDEWNQNFPPSLGAVGAPKAVAATLNRQSQEIDELRNELAAERSSRAEEVAGIMKSVNTQLHASCEGVMSERRQLSFAQQQQNVEFKMQMQDAKAESDKTIQNLTNAYESKIENNQGTSSKKIREISNLVSELEAELKEEKAASTAERTEADRIRKSEHEDYSNQIRKLKKQVLSIQGVVSSPNSSPGRDSNADSQSVVSLCFEEEANKKRKNSMKLTGMVAKAVKQLKEKFSVISLKCDDNAKVIEGLLAQVDATYKERDSYKSRMEEVEELNEALRRALSMRLYNNVDNSGTKATRSIRI